MSISNRCSYSNEDFLIWLDHIIVSNEEIDDIKKIIKSLEESGLLIKGVCEIIEN